MRSRWQLSGIWTAALVLIGSAALSRIGLPTSPAQDKAAAGFSPVAPAQGLQTALETNLKIVRDWLDQGDFLSAAETSQGLIALAQLYRYQDAQSQWQERTAALRDAFAKLQKTAQGKDAAACDKAMEDCTRRLAEFRQKPPGEAKVVEKNFKPFGATKTWMLLMDGARVDARSAKTTQEFESLVQSIAEEANVVAHLRPDARWQALASEVRTTALQAAAKARAGDLTAAREQLKIVYQRCESCHHGYQRGKGK